MRYTVWSVLLFLGYASGSTTDPKLCAPVHYNDSEHSPWKPDITTPYPGNFTMKQEFCIEKSTTNVTIGFNFTQNASWSHPRNNLSDPSRYHINNPLRPYPKDGQPCVNSSITLLNVTEDDHGVYSVAVSTTCGSKNSTSFTLGISPQCDKLDLRPVNQTQKPVTVSNLIRPPSLSFQFYGNSEETDYVFYLTKSGEKLDHIFCDSKEREYYKNLHVSCYRDIPQCNTTLSVQFNNFTKQDVGRYCVVPSFAGSGSTGNMSCVELEMQQSDQALVVPLAVSLGVGVPVTIIITIGCIVVVCKKQRKAAQQRHGAEEPLLTNGTTASYQGGRYGHAGAPFGKATAGIDTESDSIRDSSQAKNGTTPGDCEALWQKLPNIVLNTRQLQKVSEQLNKWEPLARALGLEQPDIVEIQENYLRNYKEQRFQMLYKWSQREKQASLKTLVRCVEVELRDRKLAQKIVTALSENWLA